MAEADRFKRLVRWYRSDVIHEVIQTETNTRWGMTACRTPFGVEEAVNPVAATNRPTRQGTMLEGDASKVTCLMCLAAQDDT